jgi:parallel beta-helix repeat protein
MKKVFLIVVVILLICGAGVILFFQLAHGATVYYVDYANGSDSNNGKSSDSPFKHCPGDPNATSRTRFTRLSAGDTVILKGGVVYKSTIHVKWSGKSENIPIKYDGNSSGTYGKGKAVIDGEITRSQGFYCQEKGIKFISIKNFEIKNMITDKKSPLDTAGIAFSSNNEHIAISDCYVHHIGIWTNDGKTWITGIGIKLNHPTRCRVSGCEISSSGGAGIHVLGGTDCVFEKNNIHDYVNWGIDIASSTERSSTGNVLKGNIIHDLYQYDAGFWGGKLGEEPHQDFVFIRRGDGKRPFNNIVEGNLFYNNYNFKDFGGTGMVFISEGDENIIRNNIFINPHSYYTIEVAWGSVNNEIYNNLIFAPRAAGIILNSMDSPGGTRIKNNIIIGAKLILWNSRNDQKGWEIDNNYYLNTADPPFNRVGEFLYTSFAEWQIAFGNDKNSSILKSIDDFKFVNLNGYPTKCEEMDFRLKTDSPLIDKGIPITGFSDDFYGTVRPQGKGWDIGPYEFK